MARKRKQSTGASPFGDAKFFSDKEHEIIEKELLDKNAAARNLPVLHDMVLTNPSLRSLLFNPFQMLTVMQTIEGQIRGQAGLSGTHVDHEAYYNRLIETVAPMLDPQPITEFLHEMAKHTKIKREKRVLLWGLAEILTTLASRRSIDQSQVVRTLVITSMGNAIEIMEKVNAFLSGKEPFEFSYEQLIKEQHDDEKWQTLFKETQAFREEFLMAVGYNAMDVFEHVRKPFGLRFYRILHYPTALEGTPRTMIVLPGETEPPKTLSDEEKHQKIGQAMGLDLSMGFMSEMTGEVIESVKAASFGEIPDEQRTILMNAVAFSCFYPAAWSPFLLRLYQESGEKAEQINPTDETHCILDIMSAAGNHEPYKRYADLLFDKGELAGAYNTYRHALTLKGDADETVSARLRDIQERLAAEHSMKKVEAAQEKAEADLTS